MSEIIAKVRRAVSLAYYTVPDPDPLVAIELAARAGFTHVGLRPVQPSPGAPYQAFLDDPGMPRRIRDACNRHGVGILDLEFIWIDEAFDSNIYASLGELGQSLGAPSILVGGRDADPVRLAHSFHALCALMKPFGLNVALEFIPYAPVASLQDAWTVLQSAGQPDNARILIDALHFSRSGSALDDIAALPPHLFSMVQLCDGPAAIPQGAKNIIQAARHERLLPGEGAIDLPSLLQALPQDIAVSAEVPNDLSREQLGDEQWASNVCDATNTILGTARPHG